MTRGRGFLLPVFVSVLLAATPAQAGKAVGLLIENDFFGALDGDISDRYYSNAVAGVFRRSDADASRFSRRVADHLFGPADGDPAHLVVEGFGFAHSFFTPDDLTIAEPQPLDRPYAGWLRLTYDLAVRHGDTIDSTQISIGAVGPATGAEELQIFWHDVINDVDPQGWDNQLENEAVFQVAWQRKWPRWILHDGTRLDSDIRPVTEINLGNGFINGSVGAELRLGSSLGSEFGAPRVGPEAPGTGFYTPREDGFGWFVFVGAEARGVGRNLFIEGNTFRDSLGVDIRHFVHDVKAGVVLQFPGVEISYAYVTRSEEFAAQDGRHTFGLLGLTAPF